MPYKSEQQRKFFHTPTARAKGITPAQVSEFDAASKGQKLPAKAKKGRKKRKVNFAKSANSKMGGYTAA